MDETTMQLARLLGELLTGSTRQREPVKPSTLYGLLRGFERIADEVLNGMDENNVSREDEDAVMAALDLMDRGELGATAGELERHLKMAGVGRGKILAVLRYVLLDGNTYTEVIDKVVNSQFAPSEYGNLKHPASGLDGPAADLFPIEIVRDSDEQDRPDAPVYTMANAIPRVGEYVIPDHGSRQVVVRVEHRITYPKPDSTGQAIPLIVPFVVVTDEGGDSGELEPHDAPAGRASR